MQTLDKIEENLEKNRCPADMKKITTFFIRSKLIDYWSF
jgi:hypothetical protein